MPLAPGDVFAGYTVVRQLGRGGMGAVYLVQHPRLPRLDALKLLRADLSADPDFAARFLHEADVVARLSHRNIVSVLDRGEDDGQLWLTMQFVDGVDAERLLKAEHGTLPADRVVHIVTETAAALDYAHRRHLVHRDVKPANILLAAPPDGDEGPEQVFLTDFGIAKSLGGGTKLTRTGSVMATLDYASPEQISSRPVDERSDIYSLGCVLHRLLTGSIPYPGESVAAAMFGHLSMPPPRPTSLVPGLPPAIDDVVARAMAKDPAERYPTCRALAEAAGRALAPEPEPEPSAISLGGSADRVQTEYLPGGHGTALPPAVPPLPPPAEPPPPPLRRPGAEPGPGAAAPVRDRRRLVLAAAAVAVLVAVGGIVAVLFLRGDGAGGGTPTGSATASTGPDPDDAAFAALPHSAPLPDGTLVTPRVRDGNADLYLVDVASGAEGAAIVGSPANDVGPAMAPDRTAVIYVGESDGSSELRVAAADGSGDRTLFPDGLPGCAKYERVAWNPVRPGQLAVICIDDANTYSLRIVRVDGTVLLPLDVGRELVDDVAFSPDGSRLVFWAKGAEDVGGAGLFTMPADGGSPPVPLTPGGGDTDDADPVWSPDGTTIAFRRGFVGATENRADIFLVDADGQNPRALAPAPGIDQDPTWSPDGRMIAFKSDRDGPSAPGDHVWVVGVDGGGLTQLPTADDVQDFSSPAWGLR